MAAASRRKEIVGGRYRDGLPANIWKAGMSRQYAGAAAAMATAAYHGLPGDERKKGTPRQYGATGAGAANEKISGKAR